MAVSVMSMFMMGALVGMAVLALMRVMTVAAGQGGRRGGVGMPQMPAMPQMPVVPQIPAVPMSSERAVEGMVEEWGWKRFSRRVRMRARMGVVLLMAAVMVGAMFVALWSRRDYAVPQSAEWLVLGLGGAILLASWYCFARSRVLPTREVMRLAQAGKGVVTVSEIALVLDIEPGVAVQTLKALQKAGLAEQRWQEVRKNMWEFPDYQEAGATGPLGEEGSEVMGQVMPDGKRPVEVGTVVEAEEKVAGARDLGGPAMVAAGGVA